MASVLGHDAIDHELWTWCLTMVLNGDVQAWCMDSALGHMSWTRRSAAVCEPGARPRCLATMCGRGAELERLDTVLGRGPWTRLLGMVVGHGAWIQ